MRNNWVFSHINRQHYKVLWAVGVAREKITCSLKQHRLQLLDLGVGVYVRLSDYVSGWDGLIIVNCFSLTSCSEGWGTKRKRKESAIEYRRGRKRSSVREVKSEKEGRMKKKERHRRRFRAKMLLLTAVFLGSSMVQMF